MLFHRERSNCRKSWCKATLLLFCLLSSRGVSLERQHSSVGVQGEARRSSAPKERDQAPRNATRKARPRASTASQVRAAVPPDVDVKVLTAHDFGQAVGGSGVLTVLALYYSANGRPDRRWQRQMKKDLEGAVLASKSFCDTGGDASSLTVQPALVDLSMHAEMALLVPLGLRHLLPRQSTDPAMTEEPVTLHVMVLAGQPQRNSSLPEGGDRNRSQGAFPPAITLSRHTGEWENVRIGVLHAVNRARARGAGGLIAYVKERSELPSLLIPTGHPTILITPGRQVKWQQLEDMLVEAVAASSKLVSFRSGTRNDVLPALVAMTGNHTGIDPQGVRIEVGYYPEPILSTVETVSLQDASRHLRSIWQTSPAIDAMLGAALGADLISELQSSTRTRHRVVSKDMEDPLLQSRYIVILPCGASDTAPTPELARSARPLGPLIPTLLRLTNLTTAVCVPTAFFTNKAFARSQSSSVWAEHVREGARSSASSVRQQVAAVIFDRNPAFYTGPRFGVVTVHRGKGRQRIDWVEGRGSLRETLQDMVHADKQAASIHRRAALTALEQDGPSALVDYILHNGKAPSRRQTGLRDAANIERVLQEHDATKVYAFMQRVPVPMPERLRVADYIAQQSQQRRVFPEPIQPPDSAFTVKLPNASSKYYDEKVAASMFNDWGTKIGGLTMKLTDILAKRDRLCTSVKRAEGAFQRVLIEMSGEPAMLDEPAYQAFRHELQLMEACSTTSGYYNETQLLADLRAHGMGIVKVLKAKFRRSLETWVSEAEKLQSDADMWTAVSFKKVYMQVRNQVDRLSLRLSGIRSLAEVAAKRHLELQGIHQKQYSPDDPWPFSRKVKPILKRDANSLPVSQFAAEYAVPGVPVLLTNVSMIKGPQWTLGHIKEVCGSAPLGLGKLVELNPNTKKWGSIVASNLEPVTIAEYFDAHLTRNASNGSSFISKAAYLQDVSLPSHCSGLFGTGPPFDALELPPHLRTNFLNHPRAGRLSREFASRWPSLFCGPPGTGTGVHVDTWLTEFWMMLTAGQKHWRTFRPEDQVLLYHETEYDTYQADVFNVDLNKYPLLAYADVYEGKQDVGELMFIPSGSIHGIHNTGGPLTCGYTANYLDGWGAHHSLFFFLLFQPHPVILHHLRLVLLQPLYADEGEPVETLAGPRGFPTITDILRAWLEWTAQEGMTAGEAQTIR